MSEVERGEERDLIVDALNSAKSAIQGGVLPGGGIALYHASKLIEDGLPDMLSDPSEQVGAKILSEALKSPINTLVMNKEGLSAANKIDKILAAGDFFTGYDIRNEEICDMMDRGIYDSLNVVKVILEDSVSLAGMVVSTECILVKEKSY
jgi:chaperonin GroEL